MIVVEVLGRNIRVRRPVLDDLREAVYALTQLIPLGCVSTYSEIAKALGLSPRTVAKILSDNEDVVATPCHRVIRADGSLGGYTLRNKRADTLKRALIELETGGLEPCRYSVLKALGLRRESDALCNNKHQARLRLRNNQRGQGL